MNTYTAHATMRSGIALPVTVTAESPNAARSAVFRQYRGVQSVTMPREVRS